LQKSVKLNTLGRKFLNSFSAVVKLKITETKEDLEIPPLPPSNSMKNY